MSIINTPQTNEDHNLYKLLGNSCAQNNPDQAYLAYENALYHCIRKGNEEAIRETESLLDDFRRNNPVSVRNVSFAILSYNTLEYTRQCIESIRNTCFEKCYEIVVVDNASTDGSVEWLRDQNDVVLVENDTNAGFPAGCNQCIKSANPDNDIFLLNNDTVLLPDSLFRLRMGLYRSKKTGAAGAVTNCAGNGQQIDRQFNSLDEYIDFGAGINISSPNPYELKSFLIMFAMIIKRDVLNEIGLLDERFTPGNFEDNDYGMRLLERGYDSVLCHNSYIFHYGSKSFGTDVDKYISLYTTNREKFKNKWGFYAEHYTRRNTEILSFISEPAGISFQLLEIGSGLGETLSKIKYEHPEAVLTGTESDAKVAGLGSRRFDIRCADPKQLISGNEKYDYVLISDLPDEVDPERFLLSLNECLTLNGYALSGTTEDAIMWKTIS